MALGLTGVARPAAADPAPGLHILLQVPDPVSVPLHVVTLAKTEMTRIYAEAGVTVTWTDLASLTEQGGTASSLEQAGPVLTLVVLSRELSERFPVATDALGAAATSPGRRGRIAYVFYDRVERIAPAYLNMARRPGHDDIDRIVVLAHAMAHEIGHLLLPHGHSESGLMRADWTAMDLRDAKAGDLNFSSEQAASIREELANQATAD
jgi:hypothetical protein